MIQFLHRPHPRRHGPAEQEVGDLITGASAARQQLATFASDSEIRFAPAADRLGHPAGPGQARPGAGRIS